MATLWKKMSRGVECIERLLVVWLLLVFGVLLLVNPFGDNMKLLFMICGVGFLFDGLTDLYTVTAVATAQRRYELANVPAAPVLDASPGSGAIPAGGAESETSHPGTEEEAAHE